MPSSSSRLCRRGVWTDVYNAPTFGFTYLTSNIPVRVRWRRYSSGIPWYMEGTMFLNAGQNTLPHGGPSLYCRIEVNPDADALIMGH
jgi:hypothetical protein